MEILVWAWAVASARHSANAAVADASRHRSIRMGTLLSQSRSKRVLAISGFEMPVEAWPIRAKCSGIVAACQPTARHVAATPGAAGRRPPCCYPQYFARYQPPSARCGPLGRVFDTAGGDVMQRP